MSTAERGIFPAGLEFFVAVVLQIADEQLFGGKKVDVPRQPAGLPAGRIAVVFFRKKKRAQSARK